MENIGKKRLYAKGDFDIRETKRVKEFLKKNTVIGVAVVFRKKLTGVH